MTIEETRRRKLELLKTQRGDSWKELAKALGFSNSSFLSQLRSGDRPFNEKTARKFEKKLGLRAGWFDEEGPTPTGSPERVSTDLVADVYVAVRRVVDSEMRLKLTDSQLRRLSSMVYIHAVREGHVDEEYIRQLANLAGSG